MSSEREAESTSEVSSMADEDQNYAVFNSRMLVDTVGDITDEALKASRIKDIIGVLAGRVFNCCLLYTSPSPRDKTVSRMPSSA